MVADFVLAFVLLGGAVLILFLQSARKDRKDGKKRDAQAAEKRMAASEEARKHRPGTRLVCLGCGTQFPSPLTDAGCPQCHLSVLVMTKAQFDQMNADAKK